MRTILLLSQVTFRELLDPRSVSEYNVSLRKEGDDEQVEVELVFEE